MTIALSPRHFVVPPGVPQAEWSVDKKIDIFLDRVDGWHLEVADRMINGWHDAAGKPCIRAPYRGQVVPHIPDAEWAVLQIVINYFEIIGFFKYFDEIDSGDHRAYFRKGVFDVFPEFDNMQEVFEILWSDVRGRLYHGGIRRGRVLLRQADPPTALQYDPRNGKIAVNPHQFVRHLRAHLAGYGEDLRDEDEQDLRDTFEAAYNAYYLE